MRILLIESNMIAAVAVGDYLEAMGHSLDYACSARLALRLVAAIHFQAIVVVHRPPALDGLALCRSLRKVSCEPILFAGEDASVAQAVMAFQAGADDYLARPAVIAELHTRLNVLVHRFRQHARPTLQVGDLVLDLDTMEASRQGVQLTLTPMELKLLQVLMEAAPRRLSSCELEARLWGDRCKDRSEANLRVQIYNLRQVIDQPFGSPLIQNRYGLGYCITTPKEQSDVASVARVSNRSSERAGVNEQSAGWDPLLLVS